MSPRLLLVLAALGAACAAPAAASAKVPTGPAGVKFYTPPSKLPGKTHGDLIRARKLKGAAALKSAASQRARALPLDERRRQAVAVSGTVAIPKGKAPKGGWPIITWAHGTTGIADQCAPSRDSASSPAHGYIAYAYPQLNGWLKAGYAVVRTDYEGLGTPGAHPYLSACPRAAACSTSCAPRASSTRAVARTSRSPATRRAARPRSGPRRWRRSGRRS